VGAPLCSTRGSFQLLLFAHHVETRRELWFLQLGNDAKATPVEFRRVFYCSATDTPFQRAQTQHTQGCPAIDLTKACVALVRSGDLIERHIEARMIQHRWCTFLRCKIPFASLINLHGHVIEVFPKGIRLQIPAFSSPVPV
jgi:hypothetical protein